MASSNKYIPVSKHKDVTIPPDYDPEIDNVIAKFSRRRQGYGGGSYNRNRSSSHRSSSQYYVPSSYAAAANNKSQHQSTTVRPMAQEEEIRYVTHVVEPVGRAEPIRYMAQVEPERQMAQAEPIRYMAQVEPERQMAQAEPIRYMTQVEPERQMAPEPQMAQAEPIRHRAQSEPEWQIAQADPLPRSSGEAVVKPMAKHTARIKDDETEAVKRVAKKKKKKIVSKSQSVVIEDPESSNNVTPETKSLITEQNSDKKSEVSSLSSEASSGERVKLFIEEQKTSTNKKVGAIVLEMSETPATEKARQDSINSLESDLSERTPHPTARDRLEERHSETLSISSAASSTFELTASQPSPPRPSEPQTPPRTPPLTTGIRSRAEAPGFAPAGPYIISEESAPLHIDPDEAERRNVTQFFLSDRSRFHKTLFKAARDNHIDLVEFFCGILIENGVRLEDEDMREPSWETTATLLHVTLLYKHIDLANRLGLVGGSGLIKAPYTSENYEGQTALHIAAANGNFDFIKNMLGHLPSFESNELVNKHATGAYFKEKHPNGELCITVTVWANTDTCLVREILYSLVGYGANLAEQNHFGNTLLHCIILLSLQRNSQSDIRYLGDIFQIVREELSAEWICNRDYITPESDAEWNVWGRKGFVELLSITNNDGFTPLALAAKIGSPLLPGILKTTKNIYVMSTVVFGSCAWVTYDVTEVTSYTSDNKYNKISVLHQLAHNSEHIHPGEDAKDDPLKQEPISTLVQTKWSVYAWVYYVWALIHLVYMSIFTHFTLGIPPPNITNESYPGNISAMSNEANGFTKMDEPNLGFLAFMAIPVLYLLLELVDLFGTAPYRISRVKGRGILSQIRFIFDEQSLAGNAPYRFLIVAFCCATFVWMGLYYSSNPNQDLALSIAMITGWLFLVFFTRGFASFSRFSIMIQKMFFNDMLYFLGVYTIILVAFSMAMHTLVVHKEASKDLLVSDTVWTMMNSVLAVSDTQSPDNARVEWHAKIILSVYAILTVVLLVNMLIAMMNTSYEVIRTTQFDIAKRQQLSIMMLLERRLFWLRPLCRASQSQLWKDNATGHLYLGAQD